MTPGKERIIRGLLTLVLIAGGLALSACNTVRGLGQDLESIADEVDEET